LCALLTFFISSDKPYVPVFKNSEKSGAIMMMEVTVNMQIKSDENLSLAQVNRIEPLSVVSRNAQKLSNGDVVMAMAQQFEDNTVLLRMADGGLLRAVLQGEMRFAQGDMLEAVVSRSGGTCFLNILNVVRAGARAPLQTENGEAAPNIGGAVSQQILSDAMAVMKRNSGMDIETALFFAANGIADTQENIAALAQMTAGKGIGVLLGQILGMMAQEDEPAGAVTGRSGTASMQNIAPEATIQMEDADALQTPAGRGEATVPQAELAQRAAAPQAESVQQTDVPQAAPTQQTDVPQASAVQHTAMPQMASAQFNSTSEQNTAVPHTSVPPYDADHAGVNAGSRPVPSPPGTQAAVPQEAGRDAISAADTNASEDTKMTSGISEKPEADVRQSIRRLFFQPGRQTGTEMKKVAEEIPWELKTLKSQLNQTDIKNKELCLKSIGQAIRQTELSGNAVRFEHMQIPVMANDDMVQSAELYVFRRHGGKEPTEGMGVSILVALDTQHIGRVEAMIREAGGGISIEFRMEQPRAAEAFKRSSDSLLQAIEAAGYRLTGIRFAGLEKRTTVLNAGEVMDAGTVPPGIDVKI
jgi:hypothetical protein